MIEDMRSLSRRLWRLEAGCRQNDALAADRRRFIQQATFKHLSLGQKKCLLAAIASYRQGRPLTSQEFAVVSAFDTATKEECRKAGMALADYWRQSG